MTFSKDNFCCYQSIFQRHLSLFLTTVFDTSRKSAVKIAIFSKFFGGAMSHMIRQNAGEKIKTISEPFTTQKIEFKFVYFSSPQTL